MFGIGAPELALILVLALIFIGPKKLPEMARSFARVYREFQRTLDDLKREFHETGDSLKSGIESAGEPHSGPTASAPVGGSGDPESPRQNVADAEPKAPDTKS